MLIFRTNGYGDSGEKDRRQMLGETDEELDMN